MFRQGDVLFITVAEIPLRALEVDTLVVATGESHGHTHRFTGGIRQRVDPADGTQYIEILGDSALLIHEEHHPLALAGPALYRVIHQTEYRPHCGGATLVEDLLRIELGLDSRGPAHD